MQIVHLSFEHAFVVNLWQGVQLLAQCLELSALSGILNLGQLTEVSVLWMQGVDADSIVGIAILPRTRHVGIVDRQHLQNALVGLVNPVNHLLQITEVAHAKGALTTQ